MPLEKQIAERIEPTDSYKKLILAYSEAAENVADGKLKFESLDFECNERRIEALKQGLYKFLDDPTDATFRAFWNKNYLELRIGGGHADKVLATS